MNIQSHYVEMKFILLQLTVFLMLKITGARLSFEVGFQESGAWSSQEWAEYQGHLPELTEFTACHWEKIRYFGVRSNSLWAYCTIHSKFDKTPRCIQMFSKGVQASAYRTVYFSLWITGMENKTLQIKLPLDSFRHRSWNHVCWYYSSETGNNRLYYNGNLIGQKKVSDLPIIPGSKTTYDHSLILGQEPDGIRGGFDEDQAFFGTISEFNIWNDTLSSSKIMDIANCKNTYRGNAVAWEKRRFLFKNVLVKDIVDETYFCKKNKRFFIFPQRHPLISALDICSTHGGTLVAPESDDENRSVREIVSKHRRKCSTKFLTRTENGMGIWLGLDKISSNWYKKRLNKDFTTLEYHNWTTSTVIQSKDSTCAFMSGDGSWDSYLREECSWMQLCVICEITTVPVLTIKGLCKSGAFMHWNFYPRINTSHQIDQYISYKRGSPIILKENQWRMESEGDWISLPNSTEYPVGKNEWIWKENGCSTTDKPMKRSLTFSVCDIGRQYTCNFGNCISINDRCNGIQECNDGSDEKDCSFIKVPTNYQKLLPPRPNDDSEGTALPVYLKIEVQHIHLIDTENMMIGATIQVKLRWKDVRLSYKNLDTSRTKTVPPNILNSIWSPMENLWFDNAVIGNKYIENDKRFSISAHSLPLPIDIFVDREESVYDGKSTEMEVVQRWKDTYTCTFRFTYFPFDEHICHFVMRIKSPEDRKVILLAEHARYYGSKAVEEFEIDDTITHGRTIQGASRFRNEPNNTDGRFVFAIKLRRKGGSGCKTIIVPSVMLWTLAWLSLFLDIEDFTSRNRISVMVLLCLTTLFGTISIKNDFPRSTEFKYIDMWFLWYLGNIFLVNCHHLLIDNLLNKATHSDLRPKPKMGFIGRNICEKIKTCWKFPKMVNAVAIVYFVASNIFFNIMYYVFAT